MKLSVLESSDAVDPVCGMQVDPATAAAKTTFKGQTYYFCCTPCLKKFEANPEHYLARSGSEQHPAATQSTASSSSTGFQPVPTVPHRLEACATYTEYFCPMCPGVHSDRPGPCPICGMALQAGMGSVEQPQAEKSEMLLRLPAKSDLRLAVAGQRRGPRHLELADRWHRQGRVCLGHRAALSPRPGDHQAVWPDGLAGAPEYVHANCARYDGCVAG